MILLSHQIKHRTVATFTYQPALRPALPCVYGPLDYREQRALFERIDLILSTSGLEQDFINIALADRKIDTEATSAKQRKKVLREMKTLEKRSAEHARAHLQAFKTRRHETQLGEAAAQQIIDRMENVLDQLPAAIKQAHERMIGGHRVANEHGFRQGLKRRAGTEARIGIFKNVFLGRPLLAKGFGHRELAVGRAALTQVS